MFAVLMIVLNGIVGLGLLFGGLKHGTQRYNQQGANSYLLVIIPLSVICFVLPNFTVSSSYGTLHPAQAVMFSIFTLLLYGTFLVIQTGVHRDLFSAPESALKQGHNSAHSPVQRNRRALAGQIFWLLVAIGPVVLLSKFLAHYVNAGLTLLKAPPALGGLLIAIIVLAPEGISAIRAISANQLQRAINLCLGASASTLGLTLPAILVIGLLTNQQLILGLSPLDTVLMVLTLSLNMLTFSGTRTTLLEGAMHLIVFFVYISLIFVG
jgi:Ca2+:H+ antiporter